ncbi:MAG TPA: glycosyltransferase family 2 protein [Anaerolineales bacterium]
MTEPTASILILTYNNLEYNRLCLESIFAKTESPDFEVIVVDNASQDGTPQFLEQIAGQHPNLRLILNPSNEGFARGNNQGAAIARGDILVLLNNDTVVTPGWLPGLIHYLQDPAVGMVGPVTNASGNETRIPVSYTDLDGLDAFAATVAQQRPGQATEIRMLPLQCVALRKAVFAEIGPLDERFGAGMFEDDDYAVRMHQKGYRILCAEDVFIHHWGSASFSKLSRPDYLKLFSENWKKFEDKWGQPWYPPQQRPELLPEQLRQYTYDILKLSTQVLDLQAEIEAIQQSNTWKLAQRLGRLRQAVAPPGSLRERIMQTLQIR